jgi:hypothetical protein
LAAGGDPKVNRPGEKGGVFGRLADGSKERLTVQPAGGRFPYGESFTRSCGDHIPRRTLRLDGRRMLDTHERAIARSKQKIRVDQGAEQSVTLRRIQSP